MLKLQTTHQKPWKWNRTGYCLKNQANKYNRKVQHSNKITCTHDTTEHAAPLVLVVSDAMGVMGNTRQRGSSSAFSN